MKSHLRSLLTAWRDSFPHSVKEIKKELVEGNLDSWMVVLANRAGAISGKQMISVLFVFSVSSCNLVIVVIAAAAIIAVVVAVSVSCVIQHCITSCNFALHCITLCCCFTLHGVKILFMTEYHLVVSDLKPAHPVKLL